MNNFKLFISETTNTASFAFRGYFRPLYMVVNYLTRFFIPSSPPVQSNVEQCVRNVSVMLPERSDQPTDSFVPSFTFRISPEAASHIEKNHVHNMVEGPLWVDLLGSRDLVAVLEHEIQHSFQRSLFVEYDKYDSHGIFLHKIREIVTRSGIVVIIRLTDDSSGDLMNAFFPHGAFDVPPNRRWLAACMSRIYTYTRPMGLGPAQTVLVLLSPDDILPSTNPPGDLRNIRFNNETSWGFSAISIEGVTKAIYPCPLPWPEEYLEAI